MQASVAKETLSSASSISTFDSERTKEKLPEQLRQIPRRLGKLVAERRQAEQAAKQEWVIRQKRIADEAEAGENQERAELVAALGKSRADEAEARRQADVVREDAVMTLEEEFLREQAVREERWKAEADALAQKMEEANWTVSSISEGSTQGPDAVYQEFEDKVKAWMQRLDAAGSASMAYARKCGWTFTGDQLMPTAFVPPPLPDPALAVQECALAGERHLFELKELGAPAMFRGMRMFFIYFFIALLAAGGVGPLVNFHPLLWIAIAGVATLIVSCLVHLMLASAARAELLENLRKTIYVQSLGEHARLTALAMAGELCRQQKGSLQARREAELRKIEAQFAPAKKAMLDKQSREREKADLGHLEDRNRVEDEYLDKIAKIDSEYPRKQKELEASLGGLAERWSERKEEKLTLARFEFEKSYQHYAGAWHAGLMELQALVKSAEAVLKPHFPPWSALPAGLPTASSPQPALFPLGHITVALKHFQEGLPEDPKLRKNLPESFSVPMVNPFPERACILIRAQGTQRDKAVDLLRRTMLRLIASLPPGKVRFTIIDPVGLGQNFAAFMHLADYNDQLVNSRIWTETGHIEQRLTDVTSHMENVIQKYLRNQFRTIDEYNAQAGEIAEPYRFVVAANYPAGFSDAAARRLASIAQSGPRCGVFTLVSTDQKQPQPSGVTLKDLEPHSVVLKFKNENLVLADELLEAWPLEVEPIPDDAAVNKLMHVLGAKAKEANRVEVPFEALAPTPELVWSYDSRKGIDIPLGRAGATKRQHLKLGLGTSQHVLIAGKTGSGKSTLLHAMITNAALMYRPDEVELYLIDFKKGVEFKAYAAARLPHARVIAIESEREFGLSVMQRLDEELKSRGERYRAVGAQDVAGYRAATGERLSRILFMVDEFQEFFVEDDRIAQEATLLLDRLVRQGRAFGMHVLFGSQTLGGNYTLPRSTIGQMAVRIALQCSDTDAHLILSEDNTAARLLSRPGEAIYNDANGLVEGNNPFQVCWLTDEIRDRFLTMVRERAHDEGLDRRPQIIFEGNIPADLARNHLLARWLKDSPRPAPKAAPEVWLGDAVAIKDPTEAKFTRQSGSHLLLIGQQEDAAGAVLAASLIALAAQQPVEKPAGDVARTKFYILDGTPADSPKAGYLAKVAAVLPQPAEMVERKRIAGALLELAQEIERRQRLEMAEAPGQFLVIHDLQRFRDLRKQEDDYSFGRGGEDKPPSPDKLLPGILRDGPSVGVHVLCWCDSVANFQRTFDRGSMKEFEMRVLFQMSANDSSTLIDSPAASKLGTLRALFFHEEQGRMEKLRPYAFPSDAFLAQVKEDLRP